MAQVTITSGTGYITVNDIDYPLNSILVQYGTDYSGNATIALFDASTKNMIVIPRAVGSITNGNTGNPFASISDFKTYVHSFFFEVASGSLPTGGTAGQVLAKIDSTDGNAHWISISASDNSIVNALIFG